MTRKHFVALADAIRDHNQKARETFGVHAERMCFSAEAIYKLADFCALQNSNFDRERWLNYVAKG